MALDTESLFDQIPVPNPLAVVLQLQDCNKKSAKGTGI